jgi:hypothetical protein
MYHFNFSKTMLFYIPFRGLGQKIHLKTAPNYLPSVADRWFP